MRVQFTNEENTLIASSRITGIQPETRIIPEDFTDNAVTLGLRVTDPFIFNMFLKRYLEDPNIKNQIGAEITLIDLAPPVNRDYLYYLKESIDNIKISIDNIINGIEPDINNENSNS